MCQRKSILPDLEIGQEVRVAPNQRGKPWEAGNCMEKLSDRSYLVEMNGELLRRNRQSIKPVKVPSKEPANDLQAQPKVDSARKPQVPPAPEPVVSQPVLRRSQRVIKKPDRFT